MLFAEDYIVETQDCRIKYYRKAHLNDICVFLLMISISIIFFSTITVIILVNMLMRSLIMPIRSLTLLLRVLIQARKMRRTIDWR